MKYLKVWTDFEDLLQPLEEDEIGRLFLAMLRYAKTGIEPVGFVGNEGFLWKVAKRDIDLANERAETLRNNGMKGGRPKTNDNQEKPNETNKNQTEPNETNENQIKPEMKRNEMKGNERKINDSFLSDDAAAEIQSDHNKILDAALNAGFKSSPAERAGLLNLYAAHGLEKMLNGIGECVKHSAPNLAYLEAVLKGTGKKAAGGYEQRDYTKTQDEAVERMMNGSW